LKSEVDTSDFENLGVEWIGGHTPTAYFKDSEGNVVKEAVLPNEDYPKLAEFFASHGFTAKRHAAKYAEPHATNSYGTHFYEYFRNEGTWQEARDFASSRLHDGTSGYLLTVLSQPEEDFIHQWLKNLSFEEAVWLGASDDEEGHWSWVQGPEKGTHFWQGVGTQGTPVGEAYNHWRLHEPNNADNSEEEDCASLIPDGWNDIRCSSRLYTIVEYGDDVLPVPESTPPQATEKSEL